MFDKAKLWVSETIEDLKAWKRGEKRIAPHGVRGRVFAKRKPVGYGAVARPKVNVEMLITRADGSVERRKAQGKLFHF